MFDLYKDSLENIIDNNIDNKVSGRNNLLQLLKLKVTAFWLEKAILLLSRLFGNGTRITNNKSNNLNIFLLANLSLKLLISIMSHDLSNPLLKSDDYRP